MTNTSPAFAGLALPATTCDPSACTITTMPAPCPLADCVNIPGWEETMLTGCGADTALWRVTTTGTLVFTARSKGSIALIWPDDTTDRGTASPPIVTDVPPSSVGSGNPCACSTPLASVRLEPKMETIVPGATGVC